MPINIQRDSSHKRENTPNFSTQQNASKLKKAPKLDLEKSYSVSLDY